MTLHAVKLLYTPSHLLDASFRVLCEVDYEHCSPCNLVESLFFSLLRFLNGRILECAKNVMGVFWTVCVFWMSVSERPIIGMRVF